MSKVGRERSPATANRSLFILKQVFMHGLEMNATCEDTTADLKYCSEKEQERNKFPLPAALENSIAATQQTRGKHYMPAIILLGAEHGASKQKILSLKWSDIDLKFGGQGIIRFYRTKNGMERTEFLMSRTKDALFAWSTHLILKRKKLRISQPVRVYVKNMFRLAPCLASDRINK